VLNQIRQAFGLVDISNRPWIAAYLVSALMTSALEAAGLAMVYLFFQIALSPAGYQDNPIITFLYDFADRPSHGTFLAHLSLLVVAAFVLRSILLFSSAWIGLAFRRRLQHRLSGRLFKVYLSQPYTWHLVKGEARLVNTIAQNIPHITQHVIMATLDVFSSSAVLLALFCTAFAIKPMETALGIAAIGILASIYMFFIRKYLSRWGDQWMRSSEDMWRSVSEPLRGIKTIKIMGLESYFSERLERNVWRMSTAFMRSTLAQLSPRYIFETIVIGGVLVSVGIAFASGKDAADVIPSMAMFAAATMRVIPHVTSILNHLQYFKISGPALDAVCEDAVLQERPADNSASRDDSPKKFDTIDLKNISFSYGARQVVSDVSLHLRSGEHIALVGLSGAGKTTLVDVLLGLIPPSAGTLILDGTEVQSFPRGLFSYVPQESFVIHDSLLQNIAIGASNIDRNELDAAIQAAALQQVAAQLPQGLDTLMSGGGNLSGGERQRLGIARALLRDAPILVMDEPTSALDSVTEAEIVRGIGELRGRKTVVMIAHRLSTVKSFDRIVLMEDGKVIGSGSFSELYQMNSKFRVMVDYLSFSGKDIL
jgi:ABC-type multidrug transport system fused ATPase/permease subunit